MDDENPKEGYHFHYYYYYLLLYSFFLSCKILNDTGRLSIPCRKANVPEQCSLLSEKTRDSLEVSCAAAISPAHKGYRAVSWRCQTWTHEYLLWSYLSVSVLGKNWLWPAPIWMSLWIGAGLRNETTSIGNPAIWQNPCGIANTCGHLWVNDILRMNQIGT